MSRRQQNISRKLELEKTQIRSILADFRKAKHKCIALSEELTMQLPNKAKYQAVEREVLIKLQLLDVPGLVNLKNNLVKALSQLFDIQNDLNTQKQRISARKQFSKLVSPTNSSIRNSQRQQKNLTTQQIKNRNERREQSQKLNENQKLDQLQKKLPQSQPQGKKQSAYNIPIYHIKQDSNQNKVDRISKYVASLKSKQQMQLGNMKMHCQQKYDDKIKQILHQIPEYLAMKEELSKVRKEKEEAEFKLKQLEKKYRNEQQKNTVVIEQNQQYRIIKIFKNDKHKVSQQSESKAGLQNKDKESEKNIKEAQIKSSEQLNGDGHSKHEASAPRRLKISQLQQEIQELKSKRKDAQILQIERELEEQQYNVESVVSRINSTLQNNEERLRLLREQRMKIFEKDQDIWSQLEQM